MIPDRARLRPVNRAEPCVVCGQGDGCSRSEDDFLVCRRVHDPKPGFTSLGKSDDGQWSYYRRDDDPILAERNRQWREDRQHNSGNGRNGQHEPTSAIDWPTAARKHATTLTAELRRELAETLGLPEATLAALPGLGWHDNEQAWTMPECDGEGKIIGITRRYRDGTKRMMPGGRRGLTLPDCWDRGGPILLVEGASDTLTLLALGLTAIGRPNNVGGVEHLARLLRNVPADRSIIVVGEWDEKTDGSWPGRDGAKSTAARLSAALDRPVSWTLPPGKAKDVRAWAAAKIKDREDADEWADCGQSFLAGCETQEMQEADVSRAGDVEAAPFAPFPLVALPEPIRSYVDAGAAAIHCDPSFVALPMVSMLAGAIGNSRRVIVKRGWTEPAIIWTAIIGESGTTKSPALDLAADYPNRRQAQARKLFATAFEQYQQEMAHHKLALDDWKGNPDQPRPEEPQMPVLERARVDDTTIEALGAILAENPRGTLILRDELAGWLGGFDRYAKSPKGGGEAAKWIEMHGGRSITIDRRTGIPKTLFVPRAAVSIGGGIQPGIIRKLLTAEHRDNGLLARLLMAYPPRRPRKWSEAEIDDSIRSAVQAVYDWLWNLRPMIHDGEPCPVVVPLTAPAKREYIDFVNSHGEEQYQLDGELASAWSKLEGYVPRLALVHHLVRAASGERKDLEAGIDIDSIRAGIELVRWFGGENHRIYVMLHEDSADSERRELIELIRRRGGAMSVRDLQRASRRYPDANAATAALTELVNAKLAVWVEGQVGEQGGRPTWFVRLL